MASVSSWKVKQQLRWCDEWQKRCQKKDYCLVSILKILIFQCVFLREVFWEWISLKYIQNKQFHLFWIINYCIIGKFGNGMGDAVLVEGSVTFIIIIIINNKLKFKPASDTLASIKLVCPSHLLGCTKNTMCECLSVFFFHSCNSW